MSILRRESDESEGDETINDEDIRKALAPPQPIPTTATTTTTVDEAVAPSVAIPRRKRQSSTSSTEETPVGIPARPHANVQVERSEEIQALRSQLPIITEEQAIMEAIHDNPVVLICGETGTQTLLTYSNGRLTHPDSFQAAVKRRRSLNFSTKRATRRTGR